VETVLDSLSDTGAWQSVPPHPPLPLPGRLGVASMTLALVSILVYCLPVVSYATIGLSAIGLILAIVGLAGYLVYPPAPPESNAAELNFGQRVHQYPRAGSVASIASAGRLGRRIGCQGCQFP
jgi:hypothetical protein